MSTLDEYAEFLKTLKESSLTNEISRMLYKDTPLLLQKHDLVWREGYMVYKKSDENMRLQAWEQTSEFSDLYDTLRKMIDSGFVWADMPGTPACYRERLASFLTDWDKARISVRLLAPIANYRIFPLYPEKKAPAKQLNNPVIVINSQSLHPDLAIKVINWIHSDQYIYDLFMYGLKGSDYDLVGNKVKLNGERWPFYGWRAARVFMDDDMEREFVTDPPGFNTLYELELVNSIEYYPIARFKPKYDSYTRSDVSERVKYMAYTTRTTLIDYKEKDRGIKSVIGWYRNFLHSDRIIEATQQQLNAWRKRQMQSAENNKTDK